MYPYPEKGLLVDAFFHLKIGIELAVSLITRAKVVDPVPGISKALVRLKLVNPPTFTLEDFLAVFDSLYDLIPPDILRQLLARMAGTLGVRTDETDVQALLEEITSLRQQLVEIQTTVKQIKEISLQQ